MKLLATMLFCLASTGQPADEAELLARADTLAAGTGRTERLAAAELYERLLAARPDDFTLLLEAASVLNAVMAHETNANLPLIDGAQDTEAHKKIWRELGERALRHAEKARALRPKHERALGEYAAAYAFRSASMGIVTAITKGAAGQFKENANALIEHAPRYDDGIGYFYLGAFHIVAPWPMRDLDDAEEYLKKALAISPGSVRNQYGMGVLRYRKDERDEARRHFEAATRLSCSEREREVCAWVKKESARVLGLLAK